MRDPLPAELENAALTVTGRIVSLPRVRPAFTQFRFRVERLQDPAGRTQPFRASIRLRWYDIESPLVAGDTWRLQVKLRRPRGFRNPGSFDYEAWLFRNRIRATGYVLQRHANAQLDAAPGGQRLTRLRARIRERFVALLDGHPMTGILTALAVGVRDGIDAGQWDLLRRTGTVHLVAISGLHISLVSGLVGLVTAWCWRMSGWGPLWWPTAKAAAAGALLAGLAYSALAGFSIPTRRALLMLCAVVVAVWLQRPLRPARVLALALLLVLVFDPLAVMAQGFWLSFAAVAVILFFALGRGAHPPAADQATRGAGSRIAGVRGQLVAWGRVQIAVTVGLAPPLVWYYQHLSIVSPLANALAIPAVGFVCVPLVLAAVAGIALGLEPLASICLGMAAAVLEVVWALLGFVGQGEFAYWGSARPPLWAVAAAVVGVAILLLPRGIPYRWLGVVWLTPLLMARPAVPAIGEAWVTVLDVGQGLSVVVHTREHVLVYDAGARFSERFDAGSAVVVPYLRTIGARSVDMLIVSHDDNDHRGGVKALLQAMPVRRWLLSEPAASPTAIPAGNSGGRSVPARPSLDMGWRRLRDSVARRDRGPGAQRSLLRAQDRNGGWRGIAARGHRATR